MAFPFTVNGVTYTASDFSGSVYAYNYLKLINDCAAHSSSTLKARATGGGSGFVTTLTLLSSSCQFSPGMPVTVYSKEVGTTHLCRVVSLTRDALVLDDNQIIGDSLNDETTSWVVTLGGAWEELTSAPYAGIGSVPYTTVEAVKANALVGYPNVRLAPYFEDFCGYFPTAVLDPAGSTYFVKDLRFYTSGEATVTFNGNQLELFADSRCPGVAVLTCTATDDCVGLAGPGTAEYLDGFKGSFRVYIPDTPETDDVQIGLGLGSLDSYTLSEVVGVFLAYNYLEHGSYENRKLEAVYNSEYSGNRSKVSNNPNGLHWPLDRWLTVSVTSDSSAFVGTIYDDTGEYYETFNMPAFTGVEGSPVTVLHPFVLVRKSKGSKPFKLYLDYIATSCTGISR